MDFDFTPEQDEAAELARRILTDLATPERMAEAERAGDRFDDALWRALGDSGLLSLAVPEEYGGAGLGLVELTRVLVEVGRTVAPVPLAAHGPAALLLSELGTDEQRRRLLPGAGTGELLLTLALSEEREHLPTRPSTTAMQRGGSWVLDGAKSLVRAGQRADVLLVTATTPDGAAVFLVESGAPGLEVVGSRTSDGDVVGQIGLSSVPAEPVGTLDGEPAKRLGQLATVCSAAEQLGVVEGAIRLTADYAKTREQFGRPIGSFQAVSQRLADGYIDTLFAALPLWQAVWRLSEGLPATVEVASAKLWAADAGHRVAHTAVHVHGGVGIDLDGTAHRYFTAAKRFEFAWGGATEQALAIGRALAREPA